MSVQLTEECIEFILQQDLEAAFKDHSKNFLCTHIRHGLKFDLEEFKALIQGGYDAGVEDEYKSKKVIGFGKYTLALVRWILKKNDQSYGLAEEWVLIEWKDNKCISAEIYTDRAVFDMEVTEKWLNSLDVKYEVINLIE